MMNLGLSAPTRIFLSCCTVALAILVVSAFVGMTYPNVTPETFAAGHAIPAILEDDEIPISGIGL